ncbi:MAG: oligoendopeptidase F [Anaerolineales bacterium]
MTEVSTRLRKDAPIEHTWNDISVFATPEVWEEEYKALGEALDSYLSEDHSGWSEPGQLADTLEALTSLMERMERLAVYAGIRASVDTTDQDAGERSSRAQGLNARIMAVYAPLEPRLLALEEGTLSRWTAEEPRLTAYQHFFEDILRRSKHVRSDEMEELFGMLADPFSGVRGASSMLTNADFVFEPALGSSGEAIPLSQGSVILLTTEADREIRRTAYENYADLYLAHKATLARLLETSIKQSALMSRARNHGSNLETALFRDDIPVEVFHNLIDTFRENLPTWHRYFTVRKKIMGVTELHPYDIWGPLTDSRPEVSYPQAVEWICAGLEPMGEAYVETVRRGCLEDRWVDVYPNQGKRGGAFSWGSPGTMPFIVMSYNDTLFSLSTLAHELGHSMHSYLTWQTQPYIYGDYSLFVAEVASNFHQAMVRDYLLTNFDDPAFQIGVIEEAMSNFHRYFLIMPTLARFEFEVHTRGERGEGLPPDELTRITAEFFREAYGPEMDGDEDRLGIRWAQFGHLYTDYYVFQYATGIAGANALARRILDGEQGSVEAYLSFLKTGGSLYPLDALKLAGVDLSTPEPVQQAFNVMAGMIDRLEELAGV